MNAQVVATARRRDGPRTIGLWFGSAAILATGAYVVTHALSSDPETPTLTAVFVVYLTLPLAAVAVYHPRGVRDRLAMRPVPARAYGTGLVLWLILLAVSVAMYYVIGVSSGNPAAPLTDVIPQATDYSRFAAATPADWALIVPRALILAGIAEEMLFRGMLFGWLRRRLSWWSTALMTGAAFAAVHGYYPVLIPFSFVLGIGLAWLRERTGSILPGVAVHILTDTLLFALALTVV